MNTYKEYDGYFRSIELDLDKCIGKINGQETYPFQNSIKLECVEGKWSVTENIDIFYRPCPIKSKDVHR
ncbi:hypothetical protein AAK894_12485 [Lachnospiraceae bacterium 46-61]